MKTRWSIPLKDNHKVKSEYKGGGVFKVFGKEEVQRFVFAGRVWYCSMMVG